MIDIGQCRYIVMIKQTRAQEMDDKTFLGKRRDRTIATLLSFKEQWVDQYLPPEVSSALRKEILDQINDLCDLAFDLIGEEVVFNDSFMAKLDDIYEIVANKET